MIDFAKVAAETEIATDDALPTSSAIGRKKEADPALVALVEAAASDGKRRDLGGRFSLKPYAGRKNACEAQTVVSELHRAARAAGVKVNVRKFDATAQGARVTFKVASKPAEAGKGAKK